ncbi:hypothetical protein A7X97_13695 [Stenotrophomonas sepilia]|uniref:hypothetical protein n=1 Tax=Stenotrophomonas TaxID=40323 RepID=UPI000DA8D9A4|nr:MULTISPECIES: hypothetical protein [Stenotrophomonas maltophilia group]MBN5173008.1 hypothetical protein [Stenotrophomonas maltophilia]PZT35879.1 hypothetical protein A7X97_13695 [Stenotrophomonas sepilia]UBB22731.1 hypothetical protein LAD79_06500 [Stenotrophomonas maltophilia]HEL3778360.1 hypothetical protein [Stenotrophomonas maltophilia]HEL5006789.1 hypothetical protein [Stenotrophomonas maltophilia]
MQHDSTQPISAREALGLKLCEQERDLLIQAVKNDWSVDELYDELRQAAFDHYYDGKTDEEEWKEETWVTSYKDYVAFLTAATEYPLHFAVASGDAEWAGDLLKSGRTPQDADSEGTTPTDLLGRHGNDQSDQVIRAHNRAKLLDSILPPANAWKPPEGGFGADAQRQVGAAMKAHGQDGQTLEAPRLRARF